MLFFYFILLVKWFNRILIMNIFLSYQHESKWFVAFIRFYFIFVKKKKKAKYEHLYSEAFVSHTHQRDLFIFFSRMEERCGGAIGESDVDVMTSEEQRVGPCSLFGPPPVRRDTSYQGGSRRGSSSSYIFSSSTIPSTRPVWWILFSALLSWVIWGIIPKVSEPSCSVKF